MHKLMTLTAAVLAGLFAGAAAAESPPVLMPLAEGNRWTYVSEDDPSVTREAAVLESRTVDGETWYLYEEFGSGYWLRNVGAEQWQAVEEPDQEAPRQMLALADPATAPDWYPYDGLVVEYEACEEPMTVPAGTFDCYIYTFEFGEGLSTRSVFAPGVGLIHNTFEEGAEIRAMVLRDYTLTER